MDPEELLPIINEYADLLQTKEFLMNDLAEVLSECAEKHEEINSERQDAREALSEPLRLFDEETSKMKLKATAEFQPKLDDLNKQIDSKNAKISELYEKILNVPCTFALSDQKSQIKIERYVQTRSNGITLKSIAEALVKGDRFNDVKEAEQFIKIYNKGEHPTVTVTLQSNGRQLEPPKPTKKQRTK